MVRMTAKLPVNTVRVGSCVFGMLSVLELMSKMPPKGYI